MDSGQGNLFEDAADNGENRLERFNEADSVVLAALYSDTKLNLSVLSPNARRLYELSINAFEAVYHARMSELPIRAEISRYEEKILAAADAVRQVSRDRFEPAQRQAADTAAADRGDPDTRVVLEAAYKVCHEIRRFMGLLRFCPDENGVYIARCEPDHCILPALGPHFMERFGETHWAIIDEKRRLCMRRSGASLEFFHTDTKSTLSENLRGAEWENLWRHYHKTINNKSRNNPDLQRRFMPRRYWKYLTEL